MSKNLRFALSDYMEEAAGSLGKPHEFNTLESFDQIDMDQLRMEFMRVSPSYAFVSRLTGTSAAQVKKFKQLFQPDQTVLTVDNEKLKERLNALKRTFSEYGSIDMPVLDWYERRGRYIFDSWLTRRDVKFLGISNSTETQNLSDPVVLGEAIEYINEIAKDSTLPKTLVLAVPLDLPKAIALRHVRVLIEAHYDWVLKLPPQKYRQKKKLAGVRERPDALIRKLKVLICKAFHPDMPLWKIGLLAKVSSTHDDDWRSSRTSKNDKIASRPEIATLVSRALRQGQYIAEHAAMDMFPVSEKIAIPECDWDAIRHRFLLAYPNLKVSESLVEAGFHDF